MRWRSSWDSNSTPGLGWLGAPPYAVRALLVANAAVFVLQALLPWPTFFSHIFALSSGGLCSGMIWQPVTYMFLHGGILHILFNMFALWMFGRNVEEMIGSRKFLQLYFAGGIFGAACWLAFNWNDGVPVVGASGAVYAVLIAFATLVPERPITLLLFFVMPVTLKAKWWAWIAVVLVAYQSLAEANSNVAHLAHLGGIVVGYVFIKWMGWGEPSRPVEKLRDMMHPLARLFARRRQAKEMSSDEFISEHVDPILDKISREGIHSLTRQERKILEQSQAKMTARSQNPHAPDEPRR